LNPELAVIVTSFQRHWHLERCLASLEAQQGVDGRFEVVVADDGSRDGTLELLAALVRRTAYPLTFTTHDHDGVRLARCRNSGAAVSTASYLLFVDGDCILPPDHLQTHLAVRRPGRVVTAEAIQLDAPTSGTVDAAGLRAGRFPLHMPPRELRRLRVNGGLAKVCETLHVPRRPRLTGANIAIWRSDFEAVNGFDERYVGGVFEEFDLQVRLERLGLRAWSIQFETAPVHLWHPPAPQDVSDDAGAANLAYFRGVGQRPTVCADGLVKEFDGLAGEELPVTLSFIEAARIRRIYSLGDSGAGRRPA
jgi:GT2 family glycosyltransferase